MSYEVIHGDCLDALRALPDNSVDAVVTDPPYGLSFMGKKWDYDVPATDVWAECLRVLKPGGHLLAFAGTRTQHRMCVRIEDAGFEIRDMIAWVYGQGFPKSLDVSKAIDKGEGHWRGRAGSVVSTNGSMSAPNYERSPKGDPVTAAAAAWSGWGTALKPSWESVTWATKPTPEQSERATIVSNLSRLEARLWLLSSASAAAKSSKSSPSEYDAACGTAQWDADAITNSQAALCDRMDTSQFESATTTALNIASSWKRILVESWDRASTSTTETESSTTTDLRTLKFSLSQITPESIVAACSRPGGFDANASTAERHFNASVALLQSIHTLSATGRAMSRAAENSLDAGVRPSLDPCIMARKPLSGTVAENVQEWGTGAMNIEGCRVPGTDHAAAWDRPVSTNIGAGSYISDGTQHTVDISANKPSGRWPANLIHDGSEEVEALTGSAARFFKCCEPDATCPLCCLPYAEACNTMRAWKNTLASTAEKRGWTSQATSEFIARVSAIGPASEKIAPAVKSAGNLCDSCAISIAVALVATKTSAFSSEELLVTLASTGNSSASILIPSLASFADLWGSIDTTPTTTSLSLLFGSVRDAIANSTKKDTEARAEPRCEPSRFAYVPKASKADREDGVAGVAGGLSGRRDGSLGSVTMRKNHHPTVKPTDLMRYICRLVTPLGGTVLDPFTGSGSTGKAAILEGFNFIGIEREAEYVEIARARIAEAERRHSESLVSA